ncbi:MCP four helix bundle domain-containing protein [Psychrobium sp. nBUS_13]|uniref:MCP four helix bundle domain-containing protein n=1 Tax=Psychrobium sp. nBUS_13 TaxID=3395319 RepID=UPI003EBB5A7C
MKFTLKTKLTLSFSLIVTIILTTAIFNLYSVNQVSKTQHRITDYRIETVNAEKEIKNGINQSLAALRGYMILGSDAEKAQKMKNNRQQAWKNIANGMAILKQGASHLSTEDQQQLKTLESLLAEFKDVQRSVEDIAQAPNNIPAYQLMLDQAVPTADALLQSITYVINVESQLSATAQRKTLLKLLADSRSSLATGLASIRAYLLSGDEAFKEQFDSKWVVNTQRFNLINSSYMELFTPEQAQDWADYSDARKAFESLPRQMFNLRSGNDWNKANVLLGTEAAPRAKKSLSILKNIEQHEDDALHADIAILNELSSGQNTAIIMSSIASVIVALIVAFVFSKDLLTRLEPILTKSKAITNNDLSTPSIIPKGNDELTELTNAVNAMNESLTITIRMTADTMKDTSLQADSIMPTRTCQIILANKRIK